MKKLFAAMLLTALLLCGAACAEVDANFEAFETYGKVLSVEAGENSAVIEAEGYYGYHMDENPSMTVRVEIGSDCVIRAAAVTATKGQTPGFDAMVTQEYMDAAYVGKIADPLMEADAVAGATATAQAVRYAVQTAAYYVQNALGYAADTNAADNAELSAVFAADYQAIETDYKPKKDFGSLLYAANGTAADGTQVVGMKVKSSLKFSYRGSAGTGWTAAEPGAFTMVIVVDKATDKVCAWDILVDGTKQKDFFTVPGEKIDSYQNVAITAEDVFDAYMDGIVLTMEYEKDPSEDGPMITGTSIVYTGKTEQGTFSSQLVRNCFSTAARVYMNVK